MFKFKTKPFEHQASDFERNKNKKVFAYFWEMGTGKTKILLDTAAHLFIQQNIDFLLVVAPNGVHDSWIKNQIPEHLAVKDYRTHAYHAGASKGEQVSLAETINAQPVYEGLRILTINYEAIITKNGKKLLDYLVKHYKIMCVLDESHRAGNHQAKVTKQLIALSPFFYCKRLATGTPIGNSPLRIWSQFQFLHPGIFSAPFTAFRATYAVLHEMMRPVRTKSGKMIDRKIVFPVAYRNLDRMHKIMEPHTSRVLKAECLDLPPKLFKRVPLVMTKHQREVYNKVRENILFEYKGIPMTAKIILTKMILLRQIAGGFIPDGKAIEGPNNKIEYIKEEIIPYGEAGHKIIIWAQFVPEIELLASILPKDNTITLYGGTPKKQAKVVEERFQNDPDVQFLVSNPQTGGEGYTLHAASYVVFYSNGRSLRQRLQAEDRAHRAGLQHNVLYLDLVLADSIDEVTIKALRNNKDISDLVLQDPTLENWI